LGRLFQRALALHPRHLEEELPADQNRDRQHDGEQKIALVIHGGIPAHDRDDVRPATREPGRSPRRPRDGNATAEGR